MLALAGAVLFVVGAGCADQPPDETVSDAAPAATGGAALPSAASTEATDQAKPAEKPAAPAAQAAPATPAKFVPPLRGQVEMGFTKPVTKRVGKEIVTTIKVKNLSTTGSIAGLKVDEFWYDKGGNPVGGDTFRNRKPLMPGEVIEITLRTPDNGKLHQNQYNFTHANGAVKTKLFPKL
jgi:hypothetical protein